MKKHSDDVYYWIGRGYSSSLASYYIYNLLRIANLTSEILEIFGNGNDDISYVENWHIGGAQLM